MTGHKTGVKAERGPTLRNGPTISSFACLARVRAWSVPPVPVVWLPAVACPHLSERGCELCDEEDAPLVSLQVEPVSGWRPVRSLLSRKLPGAGCPVPQLLPVCLSREYTQHTIALVRLRYLTAKFPLWHDSIACRMQGLVQPIWHFNTGTCTSHSR